jgi:hypothetical protein
LFATIALNSNLAPLHVTRFNSTPQVKTMLWIGSRDTCKKASFYGLEWPGAGNYRVSATYKLFFGTTKAS